MAEGAWKRVSLRSYFLLRCRWIVLVPAAVLVLVVTTEGLGIEAVDRARQQRASFYARVYVDEGKKELDRGNYHRAIRLFTDAMQTGADPEALRLRGRAYELSGARDKAFADYSLFINFRPSDPSGYLLRGEAHLQDRRYGPSLDDFTTAIRLEPGSPGPHVGRGLALVGLERFGHAIADFEAALAIDPHHQPSVVNLGVAQMLSGRPSTARSLFERARDRETNPAWRERIEAWLSELPSGPDAEPEQSPSSSAGPLMESASAPKRVEGTPDYPVGDNSDPGASGTVGSAGRLGPARPARGPGSLTGTWETTYLGARIFVELEHHGHGIAGVLRIRGPFGKHDEYHFTGTVRDGIVKAEHHTGHRFQGRIIDDRRLEGVLTTREGKTFPVRIPPE